MDEVGTRNLQLEQSFKCNSIAKYLSDKIKCFALFSTHYPQIAKLEQCSEIFAISVFKAKKSYGKIVFLYKADQGSQNYAYAVEVANLWAPPPNYSQCRFKNEKAKKGESIEEVNLPLSNILYKIVKMT